MIEKFIKKLKKNGQSQTWFHRQYIAHLPGKKINYTYFNMMLNQPDRMKPVVETAIQKYLDKK